jgi:SAM-dependent methyltransferase
MLADFVHRVVAHPRLYDAVQSVVGAHELDRRLALALGALPGRPVILDVGGGTGLPSSLWPAGATYICVDIDPVKLTGFRHKHPTGTAVRADGTRLPVRSGSIDVVLCKNVSHHLGDGQLPSLFRECARVLRVGGRMLFIDAVRAPERWRSRVLWRYDRGSHPRSVEALREAMAVELQITHSEVFTIHHRYLLSAATRVGGTDR